MRKLVVSEYISLDGVVGSPENWKLPDSDEEIEEVIVPAMVAADAMLLGRVTYEEFASYWPSVDPENQPIAAFLNSTPKYVVSTTLDSVVWENSILINGNVAERVSRLKRQDGKNIAITGSPTLVRSLLREGLIDELTLVIHPIVVGGGQRLFEEAENEMDLVESETFENGVVYLTYRLEANK